MKNLKVFNDLLPSHDQLVPNEDNVKVAISLNNYRPNKCNTADQYDPAGFDVRKKRKS